jgi:hypothetical protein
MTSTLLHLVNPDVDGAVLFEDLKGWFGRFIAVVEPQDLDVLVLWAVHTHLAAELYTSPRLRLDSVMPGSGKTTVLDHLSRLCHRPVQAAALSSYAVLPRLLADGPRTILIDEVDRVLQTGNGRTQDLLAIINSGYRVGANTVVVAPNKTVRKMPTFGPLAMAGNTPNLPDDTRSREVRILLMPDLNGTVEDSDWEAIAEEAKVLKDRVTAWSAVVSGMVKGLPVDLPAGCIGRMKEKWRPLKRVAAVAGGGWPAICDELIVRDLAENTAEREAGLNTSPNMVLLTDLHTIWPARDGLVPTLDLVAALNDYNDEYWGTKSGYGKQLTEHRFAKIVAQACKVTSQRPGGRGPRGYFRRQFEPVWERLQIGAETGATGASGPPAPNAPIAPDAPGKY